MAFDAFDDRGLEQLLDTVEAGAGEDRLLRCAACGQPITSKDHALSRGGTHEHTFTNPNGIRFHIGCFRAASGCVEAGAAKQEWTWFAGYAWRLALCAQCGGHLGWGFQSAEDQFYGLILDRLETRS